MSLTETDQTLSCAVPVYLLVPSIPYTCHEEESRVCTYFLSPSRKEWLKQIFQQFSEKYFLVFSLSILTLSHELQSGVEQCTVCLCAHKLIRVSSLVTQFVNFDPDTFVSWVYMSNNDPLYLTITSSTARRLGDRNLPFCGSPFMTAEKGIFSLTKRQCSEMPRYFSCCMALILQTSLYAYMSNWNEGYQFQHNLWESHDLTLQAVITYIYVWANLCILLLTFQNVILE